jgi:hypothetical protein
MGLGDRVREALKLKKDQTAAELSAVLAQTVTDADLKSMAGVIVIGRRRLIDGLYVREYCTAEQGMGL